MRAMSQHLQIVSSANLTEYGNSRQRRTLALHIKRPRWNARVRMSQVHEPPPLQLHLYQFRGTLAHAQSIQSLKTACIRYHTVAQQPSE